MNRKTLDRLQPGESGTIELIQTPNYRIRQRLLEMGLTKGILLKVIRFAPMGDPIEIAIRGYHLSLRIEEAKTITLQAAL
jgi:Fe2+ transport system protein FeoA